MIVVSTGLFGIHKIFFLGEHFWGWIFLVSSLLAGVFTFRFIPVVHIGIIAIFGQRIRKFKKNGIVRRLFNESKGEGLTFFIPGVYNAMPINVTKKNKDINPISIKTPDLADLKVPISVTWAPDGDNLFEYLESGEEKGVWKILEQIVIERVRGWAMNTHEGPATFQQALAAREEATEVLFKAVAGKELKEVSSKVPTPILFKYFNEPQIPPTKEEMESWHKDWAKVEQILRNEDKALIEKEIRIRREQVKEIQRGNGNQTIESLGIILKRLNIGDITLKEGSQLEAAAEKEVKEKREQAAEEVELEHVGKRIEILMNEPYNFTKEQARDIVQVEREKVTKQIKDIQGFDPEKIGQGIGLIIKELKK